MLCFGIRYISFSSSIQFADRNNAPTSEPDNFSHYTFQNQPSEFFTVPDLDQVRMNKKLITTEQRVSHPFG